MTTTTAAASDGVTDLSEAHFRIVFECATAIRTLAEVLANMLDTVEVQVVRTDEFKGIVIEAMDSKQVTLSLAQLHADVEMECERTVFCVHTKTLNTCIKSAQQHFSISIESIPASSSVRITSYESLSNTSITRFTLPTLVCELPPVSLDDMDYKFYIDMETNTLKGIVRMCLQLGAEKLTFKVQQPSEGAGGAAKRARVDRRHTVLTISSNGSCEQEHVFYSLTEDRDGTSVAGKCDEMRHAPDAADLETKYLQVFGARSISEFLKSIDRQNVTLKLSERRNRPLIIHHKFGDESSYVCCVVAPQIEDGDDE